MLHFAKNRKSKQVDFRKSLKTGREIISNDEKITAYLSEMMALECGFLPTVAKRVRVVAALHDIGKNLLPGNILNKPSELNAQEFEIMKTHTFLGADLLADMPGEVGEMARNTALLHHEHYNGEGYWGRYADELPLYVQIISIADVYTALTSYRPYKTAWSHGRAYEYIKNRAGTQFNPVLASIFLTLLQDESRVPAFLINSVDQTGGLVG